MSVDLFDTDSQSFTDRAQYDQVDSPEGLESALQLDEVRELLQSLGLYPLNEPIEERLESRNRILLPSGNWGGFTLAKAGTRIAGLGHRSVISRKSTIGVDAQLDGLTFINAEGDTAELLEVTAGIVLLTRCVFIKKAGQTSTHIKTTSGAEVYLSECVFEGGDSGANVIDNGGIAADIALTACHNRTGNAIGTTTDNGGGSL